MAGESQKIVHLVKQGRNVIIVREDPLNGRRNQIENERSRPQAKRKHRIDVVVAVPMHTEKMTIGRVNWNVMVGSLNVELAIWAPGANSTRVWIASSTET